MKTIIVLVMHGAPPTDFPRQELSEFFVIYGKMKREGGHGAVVNPRYAELEEKIKNWPRTAANDPFYAASEALASELSLATGFKVVVGYNEFCAPDVATALEIAADESPEKIIVATPMMTRGGEHAEAEIPAAIRIFQEDHPRIETVYAWPYDKAEIAAFLKQHITRFV
ncbi:sirohydrochlorin chelatase [Dehalogenimonas formicexedens]|nr:CbiX/SirB N-terminal domain-containing protein [Dehalogenimonas formicexedens]